MNMKTPQPKSKRGGKRIPGPGKKLGPPTLPASEKRRLVPFKFHPSTIAALNLLPPKTRTSFVEMLIRDHFNLPPIEKPS